MKPFSLPKSCLLTKPRQYNSLYREGKRFRGEGFHLIFRVNGLEENRVGISVSGIRLAVTRHRIKRIIREFFRLNKSFPGLIAQKYGWKDHVDMVIATKRNFQPRSLVELSRVLQNCLS